MHLRSIFFALNFSALTLCFTAISACSEEYASANPVSGNNVQPATRMADNIRSDSSMPDGVSENPAPMSGQGFFLELLSNPDLAGTFDPQIQIPAIWVFSPQGQGELTQMVLDDDALEKFSEEFSVIPSQTNNLTCQHVEDAAAKATGKTLNLGCANGKWIALLLTSASKCEQSCPKYASVAVQAEKSHPDSLQVKTLALTF